MFYLRVGVGVHTGVRETDRRLLWVIQAELIRACRNLAVIAAIEEATQMGETFRK